MKSVYVREVMVPIGEYATVPQEANLYEAVIALEKAQNAFDPQKHKHSAILVLDERQKVVGKITMFQVLVALEPRYTQLEAEGVLTRLGHSHGLIEDLLKDHALWSEPLQFICNRAAQLKVTDFMETPSDGAFIDQNASMDKAIHQLVAYRIQSLIVTSGEEVVGILRLADVFSAICDKIKACDL